MARFCHVEFEYNPINISEDIPLKNIVAGHLGKPTLMGRCPKYIGNIPRARGAQTYMWR